MSETEFESAVRDLIDRADINQLAASLILAALAEEQRAEFDEREDD